VFVERKISSVEWRRSLFFLVSYLLALRESYFREIQVNINRYMLKVEYAVSNRSSCGTCGGSIAKDAVRVGKETKSKHHDGWDLAWYVIFVMYL
jgi:hypothetical protein